MTIISAAKRPAQRVDAEGRLKVNYLAIVSLAAPLMLTYGIQSLLNLMDTWFIGRLSADAVAAMGAIYWSLRCAALVLGGPAFAAQTFVSQAIGGGRKTLAAKAMWSSLWACVASAPLFIALGLAGPALLPLLGLESDVERLAIEYWIPRMAGAVIGSATGAVMGFFNGVGATRNTLYVAVVTLLANGVANQLVVMLGFGMAGIAWATNAAQLVGLGMALMIFLNRHNNTEFRSRIVWRPYRALVVAQLRIGLPIGAMYGAYVLGVALVQIMIAQATAVGAAATQIVIMLTTLAYMPAIGVASAGATIVGQSIGADDHEWAAKLGNAAIKFCTGLMGVIGALILLSGPWLLPAFVTPEDPLAADVVALGLLLLWPAMAYQVFDGLYLGASFCMRGAGDTRIPAIATLLLSWLFYVPLAHTLVLAPGEGWISGLPQFGLGAWGGWLALMGYAVLLGIIMYARWRSGGWRSIKIR